MDEEKLKEWIRQNLILSVRTEQRDYDTQVFVELRFVGEEEPLSYDYVYIKEDN